VDLPVIKYVSGSSFKQSFFLKDKAGLIVDLTGATLTARLRWRKDHYYDLAIGTGLVILDNHPPLQADPLTQAPHGTITLTDQQADSLPDGKNSWLRFKIIDIDGDKIPTVRIAIDKEEE
jgi:hypothetical protein